MTQFHITLIGLYSLVEEMKKQDEENRLIAAMQVEKVVSDHERKIREIFDLEKNLHAQLQRYLDTLHRASLRARTGELEMASQLLKKAISMSLGIIHEIEQEYGTEHALLK